jgi:hypothetical protein
MPNLLTRLARINRTRVFLGTLVVALIGLFLPGLWGAVVLYAVVAALAALLAQTWSVTPPVLRLARLLILAGLAVIATLKLGGS